MTAEEFRRSLPAEKQTIYDEVIADLRRGCLNEALTSKLMRNERFEVDYQNGKLRGSEPSK